MRFVQVSNDVAVGFDAAGKPSVTLRAANVPKPDDLQLLQAVGAQREAMLREVALLTQWLEAVQTPAPSGLVVAQRGGLVRV